MPETRRINIIANTMVEPGLSGGNRIFIELAKRWEKMGIVVNVFTSAEGEKICRLNNLVADFKTWDLPFKKKFLSRLEIFSLYLYGLFFGVFLYFFVNKKNMNLAVWTTSDYWPDSIVGIVAKILNRKTKWIGSFFLSAPNPFIGFKEKGKFSLPSLKNLIFFLTQLPICYLTKKLADFIMVTSEPDKERFVSFGRKPESVIVIKGGVDTARADRYFKQKIKERKEYDACFMGRFHSQKGVLELIDIWEEVCKVKPKAKLIMIGHGELEQAVKKKISDRKLDKNITLKGFLGDGEEKFAIFKKSRVVLHPAVYDSGGMAAAEAMAWGLPGVSFNLEALKTYYPYGMLKAKIGENQDFARLVIKLLDDKKLYNITSTKARELVVKKWDWQKKATDLYSLVFSK